MENEDKHRTNFIITDQKPLIPGPFNIPFFENKPSGNESVLEYTEPELVEKIMENHIFMDIMHEKTQTRNPLKIKTSVPANALSDITSGGDFDMIVENYDQKSKLTVLEFKRFKLKNSDTMNHRNEFKLLANQLINRFNMNFTKVFGVFLFHSNLGEQEAANTIEKQYAKNIIDFIEEQKIKLAKKIEFKHMGKI